MYATLNVAKGKGEQGAIIDFLSSSSKITFALDEFTETEAERAAQDLEKLATESKLSLSSLATGKHRIKASYNGDYINIKKRGAQYVLTKKKF